MASKAFRRCGAKAVSRWATFKRALETEGVLKRVSAVHDATPEHDLRADSLSYALKEFIENLVQL